MVAPTGGPSGSNVTANAKAPALGDGEFRDTILPGGDLQVGPQARDRRRRHGACRENALAVGEQEDGKVLYLGPDRAGNVLEVVSVIRTDGSEIVIHAMRMRPKYEPFLGGEGGDDD